LLENKRKSRRRRVCYRAQIVIESSPAPIEALVRDISDNGAALRVPSGQSLPSCFVLSIDGPGVTRLARVAWQKGCDFGVSFGAPAVKENRIPSESWIGELRRSLYVTKVPS
jgi:hypothetical protein